jgi:hypothetical protein
VTHRIPPGARGAATGRARHPRLEYGGTRHAARAACAACAATDPVGRACRSVRPSRRRSGHGRWPPCRPTTPRVAFRPGRGPRGPERPPTRHGATTPAAASWPQHPLVVALWLVRRTGSGGVRRPPVGQNAFRLCPTGGSRWEAGRALKRHDDARAPGGRTLTVYDLSLRIQDGRSQSLAKSP